MSQEVLVLHFRPLTGQTCFERAAFPLLLKRYSQWPDTHCYIFLYIFLNSRNLLSVLPKYLFSLPLKVLLVSNNKLVSIPEEIGKAKELMELVSSVYVSVHRNLYMLYCQSNPILILHFASPRRTWAVMRFRCCQLRWGGFKPYENSTSGRIVFTCCLRVSPTFLFFFFYQCSLHVSHHFWQTYKSSEESQVQC